MSSMRATRENRKYALAKSYPGSLIESFGVIPTQLRPERCGGESGLPVYYSRNEGRAAGSDRPQNLAVTVSEEPCAFCMRTSAEPIWPQLPCWIVKGKMRKNWPPN